MSKKLVYALILISSFCVISNAQQRGYLGSSAGFDASIVFPEGDLHPTPGFGGVVDIGFGLGAAGQLHLNPNMEFWVSGHHDNNHHGQTVFETSINGDVNYYPPVPNRAPVKPFAGMGFAPVVTYWTGDVWDGHIWTGETWSNTDVSLGFDFLGGIDFKMGSNSVGYAEIKGKFGGGYNLAKFTFGMKFLIH